MVYIMSCSFCHVGSSAFGDRFCLCQTLVSYATDPIETLPVQVKICMYYICVSVCLFLYVCVCMFARCGVVVTPTTDLEIEKLGFVVKFLQLYIYLVLITNEQHFI